MAEYYIDELAREAKQGIITINGSGRINHHFPDYSLNGLFMYSYAKLVEATGMRNLMPVQAFAYWRYEDGSGIFTFPCRRSIYLQYMQSKEGTNIRHLLSLINETQRIAQVKGLDLMTSCTNVNCEVMHRLGWEMTAESSEDYYWYEKKAS